jgi:hypothetical protein
MVPLELKLSIDACAVVGYSGGGAKNRAQQHRDRKFSRDFHFRLRFSFGSLSQTVYAWSTSVEAIFYAMRKFYWYYWYPTLLFELLVIVSVSHRKATPHRARSFMLAARILDICRETNVVRRWCFNGPEKS